MAVTKPRTPLLRKGSVPLPPAVPPRIPKIDSFNEDFPINERLIECAQKVANWHINRGSPILAACSLLAVDNIQVIKLLKKK